MNCRVVSLFFLLALSLPALAGFPSLPPGSIIHWTKTGSKDFYDPPGLTVPASSGLIDQAENYMPQCQNNYPDYVCHIQSYDDPSEYLYDVGDQTMNRARGGARVVAVPRGDICDPPVVWDPQLGCVEPVEPDNLCYDDVVSGERICEEIDPNENPDGCVTAEDVTMCLDDLTDTDDPNDNCKIVNGKRECDSDGDNKVCGPKNGAYQCLTHEDNKNCGYFNGKLVCIDKNNKPIDENSPDHPKNGGNGDGDDTNDATDPRDPGDGGDPDNQPGKPASDFEGLASEKTLRGIKESLEGIGKTLKDGIGGGGDGGGSGDGGDGEPGEGEDPGEDPTFTGGPIEFDIDDGLDRLAQVQGEYDNVISNIRSQFSSSFGSFSGGGTMQDNIVKIMNVDVNSGFSKFVPYLGFIGTIILFAAAFISLGIIMGAKD